MFEMSSFNFIFETVKQNYLVRYCNKEQEEEIFLSTFQVIEVEVRDTNMSFQNIWPNSEKNFANVYIKCSF